MFGRGAAPGAAFLVGWCSTRRVVLYATCGTSGAAARALVSTLKLFSEVEDVEEQQPKQSMGTA